MINYREILRLDSLKYTKRQIALSIHSSRNTVKDVLNSADRYDIHWPLDDSVTNEILQNTFHPGQFSKMSNRKEPDYSYIHSELSKPGVNLSLLWHEYSAECHSNGEIPYMYTQFCDKYRSWAKLTKATMRIKHKPGDAMQVDWAGNTLTMSDPVTGETGDAYLFVAVLPCSGYAYAEACLDMKLDTWLSCHAHAFSFFGGVTRLLIPDNLKTGVTKNSRFDTIINRSYQELAEYYDTAIVPARVKHPQDKSAAEGTVRYASTWIIAALRNEKFFNISEVQRAVGVKLKELNEFPLKKREGNRHSAYFDEELSFMKPLPLIPYEPAVWSTAKVHNDYLITDGKNKYSVPFDLIGETVDIRLTGKTVEVFYHGSRVASHPRASIMLRDPVVKTEHMPEEHKKYLLYNAYEFQNWADSIGFCTAEVIKAFLNQHKEVEQGYKSCASLTKLADRYGHERLEAACCRALDYSSAPTVRMINSILKNGQDKIDGRINESSYADDNPFGITRGASYFERGGDCV